MLTQAGLHRKRVKKAEHRRVRNQGRHQRQTQRMWAANLASRAQAHNLAADTVDDLAKKLGLVNPLSPRPSRSRLPQKVSP